MYGTIGQVIHFASMGAPTARKMVQSVFGPDFQNPQGWADFLDRNIPMRDVEILLRRSPGFWETENFQALYVACWIFHPVEKGSYMIQLGPQEHANVTGAYQRLLGSGDLQARISSHLSGKGASAHEGWSFLQGYAELLVQIEGERTGAPYLFLKCEGHAMDGMISTLKHCTSWLVKIATGAGQTASPALNNLAKGSTTVEARAAENFGKDYKKLQKKLGLSGTEVSVADVVTQLWKKAGFTHALPAAVVGNTHQLGRAMLGPQGIIAVLRKQSGPLKKAGIDLTPELEKELKELAERMVATAVAHPQQHYHELRVTPRELTQALTAFSEHVP
jgi:hypothetical protein